MTTSSPSGAASHFSSNSAPNPCGIVAFAHRDYPSNYVARRLDEDFGIAVRSGLHCAPLMHEALGSAENGLVRASVSHFNSAKEIDLLLEGLRAVAREKARGLDLF